MIANAAIRSFDFLEADPKLRTRRVAKRIAGTSARPYVLVLLAAAMIVVLACLQQWQGLTAVESQYSALVAGHQIAPVAEGTSLRLRQVQALSTEARTHRRSDYEAAQAFDELSRNAPPHFWLTRLSYGAGEVSVEGATRSAQTFRDAQANFAGLSTVKNPFPDNLTPAGRFYTFKIVLDKAVSK